MQFKHNVDMQQKMGIRPNLGMIALLKNQLCRVINIYVLPIHFKYLTESQIWGVSVIKGPVLIKLALFKTQTEHTVG